MSDETWSAVDRYLENELLPEDPIFHEVLRATEVAGLPLIQVSPLQGGFLGLLARAIGARQILEVGTLGGYSAIWLGRALPPGGHLVTLEVNSAHAEVARRNLARAGLADCVEIRLGPAIETLPKLLEEGAGPFDLTFLDADKPSSVDYFDWALRLSHPGSVIVVDNVVRHLAVAPSSSSDASGRGMRRLIERISAEPRVSATALQTVGRKGHDGFLLAVVRA